MPHKYKKFLIIGSARSGTSFLQTLLDSHHQIASHGEIFHLLVYRNRLVEICDNPIQYMKKRVYKSYPEHIKTVGFKGLYQQLGKDNNFLGNMATESVHSDICQRRKSFMERRNRVLDVEKARQAMSSALKWLVDDEELKIIHIKRANKLSTLLSKYLAERSDVWNSLRGLYSINSIRLEFEHCLGFFKNIESKEKEYDRLFRKHPVLHVTYESVVEDTDKQSKKILDFLSVDNQKLWSPLKKQNQLHAPQLIDNYSELKSRFASTPWSQYFE